MESIDAHRFTAERPDATLIHVGQIGLPFWRLRTRCEVRAQHPLGAIEEHVLRASSIGICDFDQVAILLGLEPAVLIAAVDSLREDEFLDPDDSLVAITETGLKALRDAATYEIVQKSVVVEFDGLLRRFEYLNSPLTPAQLNAAEATALPPDPAAPPSTHELHVGRSQLQTAVDTLRVGSNDFEVLAVKDVLRRERIYKTGTSLLFRSNEDHPTLSMAVVLDGESVDGYESALRASNLIQRLSLARGIRGSSAVNSLIDRPCFDRFDVAGYQSLLDDEQELLRKTAASPIGEDLTEARTRLSAVRQSMNELEVAPARCEDLLNSLRRECMAAEKTLDIDTYAPSLNALLDGRLDPLRKCLERGVRVRVLVSPGEASETEIRPLSSLTRDFENLSLRRVAKRARDQPSMLIRDREKCMVSRFPLMSLRREETFYDQRGWTLRGTQATSGFLEAFGQRWDKADSVKHTLPVRARRAENSSRSKPEHLGRRKRPRRSPPK